MSENNKVKAAWIATCVALGATGGLMGLTSAFADGDLQTESVIGTNMILPYKGYIMENSDGLTGTQTVRFELYESATGGTRVWSSERDVKAVDGSFSIALGEVNALNDTVLDAERLWLSMTIILSTGAEIDLSGRQAIEVTPYAVWSKNAAAHDVAGSLNVGGDLEVAGVLTAAGVNANGGFESATLTAANGTYSAPTVDLATGEFASGSVTGNVDADGDFEALGSTIRIGNGTGDTLTINGELDVSGDVRIKSGSNVFDVAELIGDDAAIHVEATSSSGESMRVNSLGEFIAYENVTVSGSFTHNSGSGFMDVEGSMSVGTNASYSGNLDVDGQLIRNNDDCPGSELSSVETNNARLCLYEVPDAGINYYAAAYRCFNSFGAELCAVSEMTRARRQNLSGAFKEGYWMKDRINTDDSLYTNNTTDSSNFDGNKGRTSTSGINGAYCCRIISDR